MRKILVSLLLGIFTSACDRSGAEGTPWPEISFVVLDEIPEKFVFSRTKDFVPSVNRVVLLPIVENYLWNGKRYYLALADPIIVEPGCETLRKTMSSLETGDQVVRECVVLARGYCPGTLQPVINYAGSYNGKTNWLVELAKVSDCQFENAFQSITNELTSSALRIGKEKTFEVAIKEKTLLSTGELLSPVIRNDGFRSRYVLWSVPVGTEVAICLSSNAIKSLNIELLGLVTDP